VSLAPSATEILFAVGAGAQVVGVDMYSNFPAAALDVAKVGDYAQISMESVVALKPDVVLASSLHGAQLAQMEQLGLKVLFVEPRNMEGVYKDIELVGKVTGHETQAAQVVRAYDLATKATSVVLRMGPGQYEVGTVSWTPSGDRMALNYRKYGTDPLWSAAIASPGGDAADLIIAVSGDTDVDPVTWSPDGKHLLVRMGEHLWLWTEATGALSLIPGEPYIFSTWTDENIIYFLADMGRRLVGIRMKGI